MGTPARLQLTPAQSGAQVSTGHVLKVLPVLFLGGGMRACLKLPTLYMPSFLIPSVGREVGKEYSRSVGESFSGLKSPGATLDHMH